MKKPTAVCLLLVGILNHVMFLLNSLIHYPCKGERIINYSNLFKCLHFFKKYIININYYVKYGLNAQIIPLDCDGFSFRKKTSRNGLYMLDIAITCELII